MNDTFEFVHLYVCVIIIAIYITVHYIDLVYVFVCVFVCFCVCVCVYVFMCVCVFCVWLCLYVCVFSSLHCFRILWLYTTFVLLFGRFLSYILTYRLQNDLIFYEMPDVDRVIYLHIHLFVNDVVISWYVWMWCVCCVKSVCVWCVKVCVCFLIPLQISRKRLKQMNLCVSACACVPVLVQ